MKNLLYILLLTFSVSACAEKSVVIFGKSLEINKDCKIKSTNEKGNVEVLDLGMPKVSTCKFIVHSETNLINIARITNSYMIFVQNPYQLNDKCMTKYTAVYIENGGRVIPSKFVKRSGACPKGVEPKEFEYFAYKMKILK